MKTRKQKKMRKNTFRVAGWRRDRRSMQLERLEGRSLLAADAGLAAFGAEGESLRSHSHDDLPQLIYLPPQQDLGLTHDYLTRPTAGLPLTIARNYLHQKAGELGLTASDLTNYRISDQYVSANSGTTHIYLQQTFNGLDVANATMTINVTKDGRIVNVGSKFVTGLAHPTSPTAPTPQVSAAQAFVSLASHVGLPVQNAPAVLRDAGGPTRQTVLNSSDLGNREIKSELHYVPTAAGVQLAWKFDLPLLDQGHYIVASVSAQNSSVLMLADLVENASYRVFAYPTENPDDGGRTLVTNPHDPVASPFGWHDVNGLPGPDMFDTRGNNVFAQEDRDGSSTVATAIPNGVALGARPSGGPGLIFDNPLDLTQQPVTYTDAAVTNLFYWANLTHDMLFRNGFTEAAGNFQATNYTGTGRGGDPVHAFAQAGAIDVPPARNNAFMFTPPDGTPPVLAMFEFDLTAPLRDGDFESQIIVHEYVHGLTNRMTGGPANALALVALQSGGMGEGWSDFYAMWMTQKPTDPQSGAYPTGTYVLGQPLNGAGVRRYPYSFDMTVNPLTYGDFNGGFPNNEVHNAGEIWASALLDLNWLLIEKYGFSSDIFNGKSGNNLTVKLVTEALALQPANPSFIDGRNAILQADLILNKGVNHQQIWEAFSRRGMGLSANAGLLGGNSAAVIEAFDMPPISTDVSGTVFLDDNANGIQEVTEPGLAGWTVYIDLNENRQLDPQEPTTVSDANGDYTFTLLVPGRFSIGEVLQPNFAQTFPGGNGFHTVDVVLGQDVTGLNFGNRSSTALTGGIKWNDLNGDGVQDEGEPGIAGVWIYVDLDKDGRLDLGEPAAVTDANGRYQLSISKPGTYEIREVIPPGWEQTFPGVDNPHRITVQSGSVNVNVGFGNRGVRDYGDAPASYGTLLANNGAWHGILRGFHLGAGVDAEIDGQPSADAQGDDNNLTDDENGVVFQADLSGGTQATATVTVSTNGFAAGKLQGWVDFNRDGDWNDPGEKVVSNLKLQAGTHQISFAVPVTAVPGLSFARFRYGYEQDLGPNGPSQSGEVEDYLVRILSEQPDALPDQFSVVGGSRGNALNVLANDIPSSRGPLTISNVTRPNRGGSVTITPNRLELRYTPLPGFFGVETFSYTVTDGAGHFDTAEVAVTVLPPFVDPIAVDDSFTVNQSSSNNVLDVLANDLPGQNGPISIIIFSQPANGQVTIDNRGTATPSDDVLRYSPNSSFAGTDQFTYTIENAVGVQDTAQVTVHVNPGALDNDKVLIRLEATDLNGNPIAAISQGENFLLHAYVRDLRLSDGIDDGIDRRGVFAAYFDLLYDFRLASTTGPLEFNGPYTNFASGDRSTPGLIDEAGAFQAGTQSEPLGADEVLLFTVPMSANGFGVARFIGDPADITPEHDVLVFEPPTPAVAFDEVRFQNTELVIVGAGGVPTAVDNTYSVPANSANNLLDVLKNDLETDNPPLTISAVSTPNSGGVVAIINSGTQLRYTPRPGFNGTEQFTYTVRNSVGLTDTATVTVQVGSTVKDVRIRLETTDLNGTPISSTPRGSQFQVRAYTKDVRTSPPADAGVFATYFDLLYDQGLISPLTNANNPFGVQITFGPQYNQNGLSADPSTRGLIDESGAFQSSFSPLGTSEFLLYTLTFTANTEGTAAFVADPADLLPTHDVLLYEPDDFAVPLSRIQYGSATLTIGAGGGGGVSNPIAVDNSFTVAANSSANVLAPLSNDRANDPAGASIVAIGATTQGGTVAIGTGGQTLSYTPRAGFNGSEQFTYTIRNSAGLTDTATTTVHVGTTTKHVNLRLEATNLNGVPITTVPVGTEYLVKAYVQDLRPDGAESGVYAAYTDVLFDAGLTSAVSASNAFGFAVTFSNTYRNGPSGNAAIPGLLDEVGAFQGSLQPLGTDEYELFTVRMRANQAGTVRFLADPANAKPLHDTLLFDTPDAAVDISRIAYGTTSITIGGGSGEGEFTNNRNRYDVNNDGYVSPSDVLKVILTINRWGARQLTAADFNRGEGETAARSSGTRSDFYDVNADGYVSPIDVIQVVDFINGVDAGAELATQVAAPAALTTTPALSTGTRQAEAERVVTPPATPARPAAAAATRGTASTSPGSQASAVDSVLSQPTAAPASQSAAASPAARSSSRSLLASRDDEWESLLSADLLADVGSAWNNRGR